MNTRLGVKAAMAVGGLATASLFPAYGTPVLTISDGNPADTVTIVDGSLNSPASDVNPAAGGVTWVGTIGVWNITVDSGLTMPAIGSPTIPLMDVDVQASSRAGGTLTVAFSQTGFGPLVTDQSGFALSGGGTLLGAGSASASATVNGYTATTPTASSIGNFSLTGTGTASGLTDAPWTISEQVTVTQSGPGVASADFSLVVPEPTTIIAGALLLLPFAGSTIRFVRKSA